MAKSPAPPAMTEKARREARLAQALRANLRKRKASPVAKPSTEPEAG